MRPARPVASGMAKPQMRPVVWFRHGDHNRRDRIPPAAQRPTLSVRGDAPF